MNFLDIHKNKRCFIAANGPGLNDIDGCLLSDEIVFGLNRGYLKKDIPLTYLVVVNDLVERQFGDEILKQSVDKIFSNSLRGTVNLKWTGDLPSFNKEPTVAPSWQGHTVTFVALQLAYEMGFREVYLIGLDHSFSYKNTKRGGRGVVTTTDDINHFHKDYFGKGVRWDPANLHQSEVAYRLADDTFKRNGRRIYNASTTTKCDIFEKVNFEDVI